MNENVTQIDANLTNLNELQGSNPRLHDEEMVLYVKFVALTPKTLKDNANLEGHIDQQPGYLFVGKSQDIAKRFAEGFEELSKNYQIAVREFNNERDAETSR